MSPATIRLATTSAGCTVRICPHSQSLVTTLGHLGDIPVPSGATLLSVFTRCLPGHPVTGHSALWDSPRLGPLLPWSHAGTSLDILGSPLCPNTVAGTDAPSPHAICTRWIKEENTGIYSGGAKYPPNPPKSVPCVPTWCLPTSQS